MKQGTDTHTRTKRTRVGPGGPSTKDSDAGLRTNGVAKCAALRWSARKTPVYRRLETVSRHRAGAFDAPCLKIGHSHGQVIFSRSASSDAAKCRTESRELMITCDVSRDDSGWVYAYVRTSRDFSWPKDGRGQKSYT